MWLELVFDGIGAAGTITTVIVTLMNRNKIIQVHALVNGKNGNGDTLSSRARRYKD
jgi:hypothetical protein